MRIIHLSDVHLDSSADQNRVLSAFFRDISTQCEANSPVLAIVSGDIAAKGQTTATFADLAIKTLIEPLRAATRGAQILVCPGNHDMNLKAREPIYQKVFTGITDSRDADSTVAHAIKTKKSDTWAHLHGFTNFAQLIDADAYQTNDVYYTKTIKVDGKNIGIASLNSAWATRGGGNQDYGNLYVGESQIEAAAKELNSCEIRLAVLHHSLDWLNPLEKNKVLLLLSQHFHLLLCGHNHLNTFGATFSSIGNILVSNTGCIYDTRDHFNGYSMVDLQLQQGFWRVTAREYYAQRDNFDSCIRFAPGGEIQMPFVNLGGRQSTMLPDDVYERIRSAANERLLSTSASDTAPSDLSRIFVPPPIGEISDKQFVAAKEANKKVHQLEIKELAPLKQNVLICGKRESGKTTLLNFIATNLYIELLPTARIGLVLDLSLLSRITEAAALESLTVSTGSAISRKDLITMLTHGEVLVCIDNFRDTDARHVALCQALLGKYTKSRFILGAQEPEVDGLDTPTSPQVDGCKTYYIHAYRKNQTLALATKWFGNDGANDEKVELIQKLLNRLNVPNTPFLISILLWVIEKRPNTSPVNHAAAVDALVDGLLDKLHESKLRQEIDSNIQSHFLTELAVHFDKSNIDSVSELNFERFAVEYFQSRTLQVGIDGFLKELCRKGLLHAGSDKVFFKFDCFRAYFLAKKFIDDSDYWRGALTPETVGRYIPELDIFTGLKRDQPEVIRAALELTANLYAKAGLTSEINDLTSLSGNLPVLSDAGLVALEQGLHKPDASSESESSSTDTPSDVSLDHAQARRRMQFPERQGRFSFLSALRALSVITRNSELVQDASLKQEAVDVCITYWARTLFTALDWVVNSSPEAVATELPAGLNVDGIGAISAARIIFPVVVAAALSESISTTKLQTQFEETCKSESPFVSTMSALALYDSGATSALTVLRGVTQKWNAQPIILNLLFMHLLTAFHKRKLTKAGREELRTVLGDLFVALRKQSGIARQSVEKTLFLQNLDKGKFGGDASGGTKKNKS